MARKSRKNVEVAEPVTETKRSIYSAGAYKRLSADDKIKRGDSLETQHNIIENFIAANSDIRLCESYVDNNTTGTNFNRPGFQKMLADAESGKINCIIVKDLTRFGRNSIDAGYYLEKYLPSLNVRVIAITDDYDSINGDGGILLPLKNIIAESYALDIGRKCRTVWQQKIKEGQFVCRMAPYGYVKNPQDRHKLIIDAEAAEIVRQIFKWANVGVSAPEISRLLNETNTMPPRRYKETKGVSKNGKPFGFDSWETRTVAKILEDRMYVGDMVQGKTKTINHNEVPVSPDEWVCVPNTHEAIVSREVFERVQSIRGNATAQYLAKRHSQGAYTENVFKGKVFCARCGYAMHRHRLNKLGTYFFDCDSRWKYGKDSCVQVSIKEEDLKAEILTLLHKQSEAILGKFISFETPQPKAADVADNKELKEINAQLDKSGRMLKSLYESMVSELITKDEFIQMKADYEAKNKALSDRANELRNSKWAEAAQNTVNHSLGDAVSSTLSKDMLTAEMIDKLIEKILVSPDKSFEVFFKFGDEFKEVCGKWANTCYTNTSGSQLTTLRPTA